MFGKRLDGQRMKGIDPIVGLTPYIMPERSDAQVFTRLNLDFEQMTRYIREKRKEGHEISYMSLILAAYVRTIGIHPELNRFIMGKRLYARNQITVSFVTLKPNKNGGADEALVKIMFSPKDTIFDVSKRVSDAIEQARKPEGDNLTIKVASTLLSLPLLPNIAVALIKFLDRHDMMPKLIQEASPFHTGLFITNMASLGMNYVYHHIYNFGNTGVFVSMGKAEQVVRLNADGTARSARIMPMGVVIDERIASGCEYSLAFADWRRFISNPELLEKAPETYKSECPLIEP